MQSISFVPPLTAPADTTVAFLRWTIAQSGLTAVESPAGVFRIDFPAPDDGSSAEPPLVFTFDPGQADERAEPPVHLADLESCVIQRLAGCLGERGVAVHARPLHQPEQVHELTERLFSAYKIEGGAVHLAGCRLEERPFLRVSACCSAADEPPVLIHTWVDAAGHRVAEELYEQLGLAEIAPREGLPPRIDSADVERLKASAEQLLHDDRPADSAGAPRVEIVATALVWCKYVVGKLRFRIDGAAAELPFEGWAKTLVAPAFRCPETGNESFELAATDDGQITAAAEIAVCEATQARVLRSHLVRCTVTGKHVLASHASLCPVSGDAVLSDSLSTCDVCQQQVSPRAIRGKTCLACRGLRSVRKEDPRLARILGEYPGLDRFRSWKLAETRDVYIACAATFMQQTLVVLDKQTLAAAHLANKGRFSRHWIPLAELEREELLGADE